MGKLDRVETVWTAEAFLKADHRAFGNAWRYELIDGAVTPREYASPRHGQIHANLAGIVGLLESACRLEIGSFIVSADPQATTVRVPDALIRCAGRPRILLEVVSPAEMSAVRESDRRRRDGQAVDSVQEIVEFHEGQPSAHLYRRRRDGNWQFEAFDELDSVILLTSVGIDLPLSEIYAGVDVTESE